MPKFKANAYLSTPKGVVQTGGILELTKEQADRLGDKVTSIEDAQVDFSADAVFAEEEFRALTAAQQKEVVEAKDGDLNEYTNEDKRWEYVSDNQ